MWLTHHAHEAGVADDWPVAGFDRVHDLDDDAMKTTETVTLQRQLNAEGSTLKVDGVYGPNTAQAYQDWLNANTPTDMPTPAPKGAVPWWRHKVVLGLLASVLAGITARWGVDANELTDILLKIAELAGLVLAAWGTTPEQAVAVDPTLVARMGDKSVRLPVKPVAVPPPGETDRGPDLFTH